MKKQDKFPSYDKIIKIINSKNIKDKNNLLDLLQSKHDNDFLNEKEQILSSIALSIIKNNKDTNIYHGYEIIEKLNKRQEILCDLGCFFIKNGSDFHKKIGNNKTGMKISRFMYIKCPVVYQKWLFVHSQKMMNNELDKKIKYNEKREFKKKF